MVIHSRSNTGKVSVDRQPTHPPPGRIVTLGVHTVMRRLLMSSLFRARDWTLAPMVQPIDARSTATEDRVPPSRLIDLRKVHQQKIFVPGSYAWKVHKLTGSSSTVDRYWYSTHLAPALGRSWGGSEALLLHTDGRNAITRRSSWKKKNMSPPDDLAQRWSQTRAPFQSQERDLGFGYIICAILEVLSRHSLPALIP